MGLPDTPSELCLMIAENLSIQDLYHFLLTCRGLSSLLTPRLHELGVQDINGHTALQWAAVYNHVPLIKLAISRGADIEKPAQARLKRHTLMPDSLSRIRDRILSSASGGARTNTYGSEIRTPLCLATLFGHAEAFETLLGLGARMNCTHGLDTPAHISASEGDLDRVRAFVDAGFNFKARGCEGQTILHNAVKGGEEVVEYLLGQLGGRKVINARNNHGRTPLHLAARLLSGGAQTVKLLLQHGARNRAKDRFGDTPAHLSARMGCADTLRALVGTGIRFDARGSNGQTILHHAVMEGREKVLEYLLGQEEGGMAINARDSYGYTPLHLAVGPNGGVEQVMLLMQHGADSRAKDRFGNTPAHTPARSGNVDIMRALVTSGAGIELDARASNGHTILHDAVMNGQEKVVEYLLEQEAGAAVINARDNDGCTPLHLAVVPSPGAVQMVKLLMQHGADSRAKNSRGDTPAHTPARSGDLDIMRALVGAGIGFDARGFNDETILLGAVLEGGERMVEYLLGEEGGRMTINDADIKGSTPLHYSVSRRKGQTVEMVRLLLQNGADTQVKNRAGYTPLDLVAKLSQTDRAQAFRDAGVEVNLERRRRGLARPFSSF